MTDFNFEEKYLKMISFIVSKYPKNLCDDIKQELLMKLYEILTTKQNIVKIDNYIFVSLKNHAINYYKKESKHHYISLNDPINDNIELLESIPDYNNSLDSIILLENLEYIINTVLGSKETNIIYDYFFNRINQKEIARKYNTSQQNISKTIKKALNKISAYIKNHNIIP